MKLFCCDSAKGLSKTKRWGKMSASEGKRVSESRVYFLDHVRVVIILNVVLWHAAITYAKHMSDNWWYFSDAQSSTLFDIICLITPLCLMPAIFFVAGYFVPVSMDRHGPGGFLRGKAKRLLVPFIVGVACVVPINAYVVRLVHGTASQSYLGYWLTTHFAEDYTVAQFWFLPTLFFFCFLFCFLWCLNQRLAKAHSDQSGDRNRARATPSEPSTKLLLFFGLLTVLSMFVANLGIKYGDWRFFLGIRILPYQPPQTAINIWYFFLGVYAYNKRWFSQGDPPRHTLPWVVSSAVFSGAYLVFYVRFRPLVDTEPVFTLGHAFLRCMTTLSLTVALLKLCQRWLDAPNKIWRKLSENSFSIYIIHQGIIVYLQYLLRPLTVSCYVKFAIVYAFGLLLSYLVSEYVLRRLPGLREIL